MEAKSGVLAGRRKIQQSEEGELTRHLREAGVPPSEKPVPAPSKLDEAYDAWKLAKASSAVLGGKPQRVLTPENEKSAVQDYLGDVDIKLERGPDGRLRIRDTHFGASAELHPDAKLDFNEKTRMFDIKWKDKEFRIDGSRLDKDLYDEFSSKVNYLDPQHLRLGVSTDIRVTEEMDPSLGTIKVKTDLKKLQLPQNGWRAGEQDARTIELSDPQNKSRQARLLEASRLDNEGNREFKVEVDGIVFTLSKKASHEDKPNEVKGLRAVEASGRGVRTKGGQVLFAGGKEGIFKNPFGKQIIAFPDKKLSTAVDMSRTKIGVGHFEQAKSPIPSGLGKIAPTVTTAKKWKPPGESHRR